MELIVKQKINLSLDEAWDFFSSPRNLDKITPPEMKFRIVSADLPSRVYTGMIINYIVSPFLNIGMKWMTEITHVKEKAFFVDNQLSGPFKVWHHQHHFREIPGGVEMTDIINYKAPFGFIGRIAESLFVNRQVKQIFEYRRKVLTETFGN